MDRRSRWAWLLPVVLGASCGGAASGPKGPWPKARPTGVAVVDDADGFAFRLDEGSPPAPARASVAAGEPLDARSTAALLARLPAMKPSADGGEKPVALRDASKPPPKTGKTVSTPFPPPRSAPPPEVTPTGAPKVLRMTPTGEVGATTSVTITFSQPMVPLTSVGDLARGAAPARLSPEPSGTWRWLGTKTLTFEPSGRFPMATDFAVEVPASVKSASGAPLAEPYQARFSTGAPRVVRSLPASDGPVRPDTPIVVELDQRIDPAAVLATVKVTAGGAMVPVQVVPASALRAAPGFSSELVDDLAPGRWLAFRAQKPLPSGSRISVSVGPGTPSAEGPRKTTTPHAWSFQTFGPLKVVKSHCSGGQPDKCTPSTPMQIELSNPVDAERFDDAMVHVSPDLPGKRVEIWGNTVAVVGRARANTDYEVTLAPTLADEFGQALGAAQTREFEIGDAEPQLSANGGPMVVLDPAGGPRFSVFSVGHDTLQVRAHAVGPEHWHSYGRWLSRDRTRDDSPPPGRQMVNRSVDVAGGKDELSETRIDLAPALRNGLGQVILTVTPPNPGRDTPRIETWVQVTRIGIDGFADGRELLGWATGLADGKPLAGVELSLIGGAGAAGARASTAATGLGTLALGESGSSILLARKGDDVAMLPDSPYPSPSGGNWMRRPRESELRWYIEDDRGMYRPGEEVKILGWLRRLNMDEGGDVGRAEGSLRVNWVLRDARNVEIQKGSSPLGVAGGFSATLKLPKNVNLGPASLTVGATPGEVGQTTHAVMIQEFRRPEFEVTTSAPPGPHFAGSSVDVGATAAYFAGGGLSSSDVAWTVTATPTSFTPPNREGFTFGRWIPWWHFGPHGGGFRGGGFPGGGLEGESVVKTYKGRTDGAGRHDLRIDMEAARPLRPRTITAEASVEDKNRQAWASSTTMLVHPAAQYLGLRTARPFVQMGESLVVEGIVVDLDGKAVSGRKVNMRLARKVTEGHGRFAEEREVDATTCDVQSGTDVVRCTFKPGEAGSWKLTGLVTDEKGRQNQSELTLWVAGDKRQPSREATEESVELVPDKRSYRRGDTAEVLVMAPFAGAEGLLSVRRSGIVSTQRFTMNGAAHTLRIPIDEAWTPGVEVVVDLVGAAPRTTDSGEPAPGVPKRPAFASGTMRLSVPPAERTLAVEVRPREEATLPGAQTTIDVLVKDAANKPLGDAEVGLVVVDESVLSLTGHRFADPVEVFYPQRDGGTMVHRSRSQLVLASAASLTSPQSAQGLPPPPPPEPPGGGGLGYSMAAPTAMAGKAMDMREADGFGSKGGNGAPIRLRTDFSALAAFAPSVRTGADGKAAVPITLPDNLTRYRVMAVAVAGDKQFGKGEGTLTARLPLMVRPSPPRFLNFGDRFELPVTLQNQTAAPISVDVAVRTENLSLTAAAGRRVTVAAGDRVEVRFPAAAAQAGTARFQIGAATGKHADAAEGSLPVWTPATTEAFATYGEVDSGAISQPVAAPSGVLAELGGLEITTSSTAVSSLTDAVLYLARYPFECNEQLASRVIAVAALRDVLAAFRAQGLPPPAELELAVGRDLARLASLQNDDGGFGFWRRGEESWPMVGIHVANAFVRAQEKKFAVPPQALERSKAYLRRIETAIPRAYGVDEKRVLVAYALAVRARMGERDVAAARKMVGEAGAKLPLEAAGFLLQVMAGSTEAGAELASVRQLLSQRVSETAGNAHFATAYEQNGQVLLASERRADGVILEGLIADQPKSDLIPKLVSGLMAHRTAGRWGSTQENAFVLLALDRYFATYEKVTPDFVARAWLGDRFAGEHTFKGRTTERQHVDVPMRELMRGATTKDLVIAKDGAGRLYYRVGLRYVPKDTLLPASSNGFSVERTYSGVDAGGDVRRDADGTWRIRAGSRVRVRVTMVAPTRRYHVALVDPLPAGLEAVDPSLAVSGNAPPVSADAAKTWRGTWFQHQNLRDERAEAFTTLLWEGQHVYEYVARATTPGTFVVPPPKAEEMYHPETFGRGASDRVIVE